MQKNDSNTQNTYPPVVTVLGHVDHGKTSLLDSIRKTSQVSREVGGITQKIGASTVVITHDNKKRKITFVDTPGHEAFSAMRSRGANVADIGLLVISSSDGVMPQTRESIELLKSSQLPFIVVLTKSDLETKNPEKVKQQLLKEQIMLEGYGGDVPVIEVSSKTNYQIQELLDLIILIFDMRQTDKDILNADFEAIVIESRLDQKAGPKATLVVKKGKVSLRDEVVCESVTAKVKSMLNDRGEMQKEATVGDAVELLGWEKVPPVGGIIKKITKDTVVKKENTGNISLQREISYRREEDSSALSLVLVADTLGSLEAISASLPKEVKVIEQKTGEVTENDILLAKSTSAIVLSFNAKVRPEVSKLAMTEKVLAKNYSIIYEMLDEIGDVLEGKRLSGIEQIYGKCKVLALFPFNKETVLGVQVTEGRVAKGDTVRVERGENVIGESSVSSVRQGKSPVSKAERGNEAGILLSKPLDIRVGDVIISHS